MDDFQKALEDLINAHSQEAASGTPDFIIAQYLMNCLRAYNLALKEREDWYGRSLYGYKIELELRPDDEVEARVRTGKALFTKEINLTNLPTRLPLVSDDIQEVANKSREIVDAIPPDARPQYGPGRYRKDDT